MAPPVVALLDWLPAAFDPVLILVAVWLGWRALGISILVSWGISSIGIPWVAPVRADALTLFPVRFIAALLWAGGAYAARRVAKP